MSDWRTREAWNAVHSRGRNEWIHGTSRGFGAGQVTTFVCECGDAACEQCIELTPGEYDIVRSHPARFAIARGHENPESEAVVSENARFSTIDKIEGAALLIARATRTRGDDPKD